MDDDCWNILMMGFFADLLQEESQFLRSLAMRLTSAFSIFVHPASIEDEEIFFVCSMFKSILSPLVIVCCFIISLIMIHACGL